MPFEFELSPAYNAWVLRPAEHLSVFDNITDLATCKERTGANATAALTSVRVVMGENVARMDPGMIEHLGSGLETAAREEAHCPVYLGDRNNPFFTNYPAEFQEAHPEAYMRDGAGRRITVVHNPILGTETAVPAVDDPTLMGLAGDLIRDGVRISRDNPFVSSYVIGTEEAYPDYFGLPVGDFRPASLEHFRRFAASQAWPESVVKEAEDGGPNAAWFLFREQAMADRAAACTTAFLAEDATRPIFFPTHGHPFSETKRRGLGLSPTLLLGACDGLEMGHITINNDTEDLNLLFLATFASMGAPVMAPRLGNKTLDPEARGGGRSFTPSMLRRLVYECLGMGTWHIGPIHWRAQLGDGEWFIKDTPAEAECARVFAEIQRAWPLLTGMSRMQPKVGLYISDATWLHAWDPRWTGFFQDAAANHCPLAVVGDGLLSAELAARVPVIVSIGNERLSKAARKNLAAYEASGGTIIAVGAFGALDELGRPHDQSDSPLSQDWLNLVRVPAPASEEQRRLVNAFQTGEGAYTVTTPYVPIDFQAVAARIEDHLPRGHWQPFSVEADGPVRFLPLTDGFSVLCVLINLGPENTTATLRPRHKAFSKASVFGVRDVLTGTPLEPKRNGSVRVGLTGLGTALVWFHPRAEKDETSEAMTKADKALAGWRKLGACTEAVAPLLREAHACADDTGHIDKAHCLARRVLASLGFAAEARRAKGGGLLVSTRVFDATGAPAAGLSVSLRLTPGDGTHFALEEEQPGLYTLHLPEESMPRFYDHAAQRYSLTPGPIRLVLSAHGVEASGGAILVCAPPGTAAEHSDTPQSRG